MNDYLPLREACEKSGMTSYILNKLITQGKVRFQETTDITSRRHTILKFVCFQDIIDAKNDVALQFLNIKEASSEYGVTPSAIRYYIKRGRIRWRRDGACLQPCQLDLEMVVRGAKYRPCGRPKMKNDSLAQL